MQKVIIDCDPGIDDALALILAIKSPELQIEAITTVSGNLTADRCYTNVLKIMELMKVDFIPVAQGSLKPLVREFPTDPFSHGQDGLGNTNFQEPAYPSSLEYAPDLIVKTVNQHPNEITLITLGPLTNIALALMQDPTLANRVQELIIIGGAFGFNPHAALNATGDNPVSEWNIYVDPEAAKLVFHSGINITALGLDVATHRDINFTTDEIEHIRSAGKPETQYLLDIVDFVSGRGFQTYTVLIDSTAIATAIHPDIFETKRIHVDIETQGELTRGQTVTDIRDNFRWTHLPAINAAHDADFGKFRDFVITTITS